MKKRALLIFGSPHNNGFTYGLYKYCLNKIDKKYDVKIFNAYDSMFRPCIDCGFCCRKVACRFDDMDNFDMLFRRTELLIIATPFYNFSFPAPLKAIIDRFQRYYNEKYYLKRRLKEKLALLIMTCGRENNDKWIKIFQKQLKILLNAIDIKLIGSLYIKNTDNLKSGIDKLSENIKIEIDNVIKNL